METKTLPTKTLNEWLDVLPGDFKDKVLHYNEVQGYTHRLEMEFASGIVAFSMAFDGGRTPEGSEYWVAVSYKYFKPVY